MTSWQDQQARGGAGRTGDDAGSGQPMSRRAAREAERRAAEAVEERPPHPSGVVDFQAHDVGSDFTPDQDFNVGDTQDIWAALTRGEGRRAAHGPVTTAFPVAAAPTGSSQTGETGSVSGELLDRVRDAVLRRAPEPAAPEAAVPPSAPSSRQQASRDAAAHPPQSVVQPPRTAPQSASPFDATTGPTRRERRQREQAAAREDDLPADLFADRVAPAAPPVAFPAASADFPQADDYFSDEPYAPEPTAVIPSLRAMELDAPASTTSPVGLPQAFVEPTGDDALTFSSPVRVVPAEPRQEHPAAAASAAFVAPGREPWDAQSLGPVPTPRPMQAPSPFLEPHESPSRFADPELGPPSEVTDLAGFEALIRRARQQPAPRSEQPPGLAWADDEEVQEGFTGLIGRSVQGSHGSSNALILPNDPQPVDVTQAVSGTGDIFVTGSMNLSRSLSTTGATSDYDSHEVDRMFDASQDEPAAAGVAPVRASRAVSGTDQHRAIVSGRASHGTLLPTILAVVAGALAVGVVALLIGSRLSGIF